MTAIARARDFIRRPDFGVAPEFVGSGWIVVNTQPHRERIAVENLELQDFAVYLPLIRRTVRHARREKQVTRPLFPGYIFVARSPEVPVWRPILSTIGVRNVVRFGSAPSLLDDAFVAALKDREVDGAIPQPEPVFKAGDNVRISDGPLTGHVAEIVQVDERRRVTLLMSLLNRPVRVQVAPYQLSPDVN
ncbi:MAG: transcription termination/antitermination NusG family protein [Hyphomicrobium sp.]|nr:transcription termination/antitermination NusG family protein [Hyphomicrobium sp.]